MKWILGALSLAIVQVSSATPALAQQPAIATVAPARFTVEVTGTGPNVILIPGLSAGRNVWAAMVRAVPGFRYHLIQVAGFAGDPARGNARGPVVASLARALV